MDPLDVFASLSLDDKPAAPTIVLPFTRRIIGGGTVIHEFMMTSHSKFITVPTMNDVTDEFLGTLGIHDCGPNQSVRVGRHWVVLVEVFGPIAGNRPWTRSLDIMDSWTQGHSIEPYIGPVTWKDYYARLAAGKTLLGLPSPQTKPTLDWARIMNAIAKSAG